MPTSHVPAEHPLWPRADTCSTSNFGTEFAARTSCDAVRITGINAGMIVPPAPPVRNRGNSSHRFRFHPYWMNLFFTPHDQGGVVVEVSHAEALCARFHLVCWTCRSGRLFVGASGRPTCPTGTGDPARLRSQSGRRNGEYSDHESSAKKSRYHNWSRYLYRHPSLLS